MFIHVGLQKTGTTALQELVFKNMNVNYFRYLDKSIHKLILADERPVLWSNEDLSGTPHVLFDNVKRCNRFHLAFNLKHLFPDASIIVGTRNPDTWIRSMYKESVRQGLSMSFDQFMCFFDKSMLDIDGYVKFLKTLFSDVCVYSFEELQKDFDSVAKGICDFIGVNIPSYENKILNKSLTDKQVKHLIWFNGLFYHHGYNPNGRLPQNMRWIMRKGGWLK